MSTMNETDYEWEFYLTTPQAQAIFNAAQNLLSSWQRASHPTAQQLDMQRKLASGLERLQPQINEILYKEAASQ